MSKECRNCHLPMTQKTGSFQHSMAENKVTLHDVPYWECTACEHAFYDDANKVEEKIVEAILLKRNDISYN